MATREYQIANQSHSNDKKEYSNNPFYRFQKLFLLVIVFVFLSLDGSFNSLERFDGQTEKPQYTLYDVRKHRSKQHDKQNYHNNGKYDLPPFKTARHIDGRGNVVDYINRA